MTEQGLACQPPLGDLSGQLIYTPAAASEFRQEVFCGRLVSGQQAGGDVSASRSLSFGSPGKSLGGHLSPKTGEIFRTAHVRGLEQKNRTNRLKGNQSVVLYSSQAQHPHNSTACTNQQNGWCQGTWGREQRDSRALERVEKTREPRKGLFWINEPAGLLKATKAPTTWQALISY